MTTQNAIDIFLAKANVRDTAFTEEEFALIEQALRAAQRVDVQALKKERVSALNNGLVEFSYNSGWNDCIDHLAATGRLAGIPEGYVLISEELVQFLNGEGTLDGWGFGERPAKSGAFWWRKYLPKTQEEK